ncbi:MAG: RNA methyltransferase [bacterium]|nr:RNA methyltransferase [bacterium]
MPVKGAKKILALKRRRVREAERKYLVEGMRLCEEAIASQAPIDQLIFCHESLDRSDRLERLFQSAIQQQVPIQQTNRRAMQGMCETQTPQGVLGVVPMPDWDRQKVLTQNAPLLLLDRIADPGNLGMILRTAEASGTAGVFLSHGSVELFNPKVVRSTMGAIFRLPVFPKTDLPALLKALQKQNTPILMAHMEGTPYSELPPMKQVALLLGNEAFGVDPVLIQQANQTVSIPMAPPVDSLNIAVATGILLYKLHEGRQT